MWYKHCVGILLHFLYRGLGTGLLLPLLLLRPLIELLGRRCSYVQKFTYGFPQRLGHYPKNLLLKKSACRIVWMHASSVGEVQAARVLVREILATLPNIRIILSSTTEQGQRLAQAQMPPDVVCLMAPLDIPHIVCKALLAVQADCYICLETELWPVMLREVQRARIPLLLLNGRMSQRSCDRYLWVRSFMAPLLRGFSVLAVISEADAQRYAALGVAAERIQICGNLKDDMPIAAPELMRASSRQRLCLDDEWVLLCGSTHDDEEAQLLPVFRTLMERLPTVWVIAPRHLERLSAVEALLHRAGLAFDRFSRLAEQGRSTNIILIDSMGDLADLYAAGDAIFCGGSLVDKGGHNVLEAARCGRPVFFGPSMKDFHEVAAMLVQVGGGFQVTDGDELLKLILVHLAHPEQYALACVRAAEVATSQRGAVNRQVDVIRQTFRNCCSW